MKLQALPVFGFETSGCNFGCEYTKRNLSKALSALPIINIITGISLIVIGHKYIQKGQFNIGERVDHPKLKGVACITRGVVTLLGGGILFVLADIVTTIGRAALKKESAEVLQ